MDVFYVVQEIIGAVILLVVIVHILGALKHKFIDKDTTMQRMTLK